MWLVGGVSTSKMSIKRKFTSDATRLCIEDPAAILSALKLSNASVRRTKPCDMEEGAKPFERYPYKEKLWVMRLVADVLRDEVNANTLRIFCTLY